MLRQALLISLFAAFASVSALGPARAETLYLTEIPGETQPGDEAGITLEIVRAIFQEAGLPLTEEFLPWSRAIRKAEGDGFIAPFSRTPEREDRFNWVVPLFDMQFVIVSLDDPVDSKAEAAALGKIGVWRDTYMQSELEGDGFENLYAAQDGNALVRLLEGGRIDTWYGSLSEARYLLSNSDAEFRERVRFGVTIRDFPVWLAAGWSLPEETTEALRLAFDEITGTGQVDAILRSRDDLFSSAE